MGLRTFTTMGELIWYSVQFISFHLNRHVWFFATPWTVARQASLSTTPRACSHSCPLSWWYCSTVSFSVIPFSCAFKLSQPQGIFQWASYSHQVAKVQWIFRTDFPYYWLVWSPCCLQSLPQHHSSKPSIHLHSAFFMVQLSHPNMTEEKP